MEKMIHPFLAAQQNLTLAAAQERAMSLVKGSSW
jgi:hypothetical protein